MARAPGAQYQGLGPSRADDGLGFGGAQSIFSDRFSDDLTEDSDTVVAPYYSALVKRSDLLEVTIAPRVQHIKNAGWNGQVKDATVVALRAEV